MYIVAFNNVHKGHSQLYCLASNMMALSAILNDPARTARDYDSSDEIGNHSHQESIYDCDQHQEPHEPERRVIQRRSKIDPRVRQLFVDHVERTECSVRQAAITFDLKYTTAIAILWR